MKHLITTLLIALLSITSAAQATEANYCADAGQNRQWQQRLGKYPGDPLVQKLFALRKGLCAMVAEGTLELSAAAQLFAGEQGRSVMQRMQDEAQQNPYRSL